MTDYTCDVIAITDGDTYKCAIHVWPPDWHPVFGVRLRGVDTPEKGHRAKCPQEATLAQRAQRIAALWIKEAGGTLTLKRLELGTFKGRVIADVWAGQESLARHMLAKGAGRPMGTTRGKLGWCR